ncbi:hypothetical protein CERSUDRAFT_146414 [Gelatoporia subvermispora B]|uniref:ATP11-domain-containing protein n=1 Tax=Ceriporiopsis subvermispora (strain B) TaxID=914234 RepID=M2RRF4_CERS8|nr:hypothetical protein CERSUDRAFT_146414 [Gelatoporia subvermispora B]
MSLLPSYRLPTLYRAPSSRLYSSIYSTSRHWQGQWRRHNSTESQAKVDYQAKYAEKLHRRAEEEGVGISDMVVRLKERQKEERRQKELAAAALKEQEELQAPQRQGSTQSHSGATSERRDSSPVKPLNSILKLDKVLSSSTAGEQVAALWNAYHGSRTGGTGRGFLSASMPVATYENMLETAKCYPRFVVPLPRESIGAEDKDKQAYEFYYMEWSFHGSPPEPKSTTDLFSAPKASSNPHTSTILFTPLQEYKLRQSFATPYFVMTHYPDLAQSHGIVLLRGEITPSAASSGAAEGDGRFMLSQEDAHRLAVSVQAFYLWNDQDSGGAKNLLQKFHENPDEFNWEDLLKTVKV